MTKTMKQSIAVFAVIAQLLILIPFGIITVNAEESNQLDSSIPVLNETVVGTVSFQSFNFLGDNASGSDGVDYSTTFYYTDDYFAPSAVNPKVSNITDNNAAQNWTMLEDISMAACSKDFAVASYTSAIGDVVGASSQTWNNTDYDGKQGFHEDHGKAENIVQFLSKCGFSDIVPNAEMTCQPSNDSIGYTLASKEITVWNGTENAKYTLVAVGMRGAGYGAEWASNVTIGDPATNKLPANGRHYGFDHSADIVCEGIQDYLNEKNITGNVKYWVTGFSRAGAVANLVAGKLTDNGSDYYTTQDDVYGYTWECPQAAKKQSGNVTNYKNIHNIINAMDAVPKVSPSAFNHQRLGVDYVMPYYKNTTSSENTKYYSNMREVLKKVAVGAYNYAGEAYTEDPLIGITDPANYPYNKPMTIYTITPTQLISDALNDRLMENFGTSSVSGGNNKLGTNIYIDQFVDNLINVFLTSKAWVGDIGGTRSALQNRATFIADYQNDFRNVLGYLLDYSGPAFLGMVDALVDAVGDQMSISNTVTNAGLGLAFLNFYEYPTGTYKWGVPPFIDPWVGSPSWANQTRRAVLISEAQPVVKNVIRNMVGSFVDPQGITRPQFENSMDHLVELVVNLYADELSKYNSNYFGTTLHYMWQILSAHEQEVVLSWIMSLDPNHMNRSYRTIEVPKSSVVELYEYRPQYSDNQYDGTIEGKGSGIRVAKCSNGEFIEIKDPNGNDVETLDQRIWVTSSGNNMVIRYPSSLDIRADVTTTSDVPDLVFNVSDYQTTSETVDISAGESQYQRVTGPESTYKDITNTNITNAKTINDYNTLTIPMSTRDILHIYSKGTEAFNESGAPYSIDKDIYTNVVVEGQFIHDGTETTFGSSITDDNGNEVALKEQANKFVYKSQYGDNLLATEEKSHLGHDFTITVPEVSNGHYVEEYFVTDASGANNDRLSQGEVPYKDPNARQGSFTTLDTEPTSSVEKILGLKDQVFHVFYSGSPAAPTPITRIIDFNSKMILATNSDRPEVERADNGTFDLDDEKNATYQLKSEKLSDKSDKTLVLNSAYCFADSATIKGTFDNESKRVRKRVTVVPASSIYFDDDLAKETISISNIAGYNGEIEDAISKGAKATSGTFYFTFYGTGIDVYCTTHENGGFVSAAVFTGTGESACVKANRVGSAKTVREYSAGNYYNTPAVNFTGLTAGTYTLKLVANDNAQFKLDGVRVYNPVQAGSAAETELNKTDEANATYLNLRKVLLNDDDGKDVFTVTNSIPTGDVEPSAVSGVLFINDVSSVVTTSNWYKDEGATEETFHDEPGQIYQSQFDVYKANGPKNEIYLNNDQAVTFQLNTAKFDENTKVYIGLSAPVTGRGNVVINDQEVVPAVASVMDMYYPIDIDLTKAENNSLSVTVKNVGSDVISVTNLKITGNAALVPASAPDNEQESLNAARTLFAPVTMKTVRMAVNKGIDPEEDTAKPEDPAVTEEPEETEKPDDGSLVIDEPEETVTPTPAPSVTPDKRAETGNTIQKVVKSITRSISSFFKSIFRR